MVAISLSFEEEKLDILLNSKVSYKAAYGGTLYNGSGQLIEYLLQ
jgi:hypothetical protein